DRRAVAAGHDVPAMVDRHRDQSAHRAGQGRGRTCGRCPHAVARVRCPHRAGRLHGRGRMNDAATAADGLNFDLPDEIRMLKETVRKFVDRELIPIERTSRVGHKLKPEVRAHLRAKAQELGLIGYDVPLEYGGLGMGLVAKATVWAELGRTIALPSRGVEVFGPNVSPILYHLNETQKQKYLL